MKRCFAGALPIVGLSLVLAACGGEEDTNDGNNGTPDVTVGDTVLVAVVNPEINDGHSTGTPNELGDDREGVAIDTDPGEDGITEDGMVVLDVETRNEASAAQQADEKPGAAHQKRPIKVMRSFESAALSSVLPDGEVSTSARPVLPWTSWSPAIAVAKLSISKSSSWPARRDQFLASAAASHGLAESISIVTGFAGMGRGTVRIGSPFG